MKPWILMVLSLCFLCAFSAKAASSKSTASESDLMMYKKRGLSVAALGGLAELSVLNQDATRSSYKGFLYGIEPSFRLASFAHAEVHVFAKYLQQEQDSNYSESESLSMNQQSGGLKIYLVPSFYVGIGYGFNSFNFEVESENLKVKSDGPSIGAGFEMHMMSDYYIGLHGWYSNSPLENKPPLSTNSYTENGAIYLSFTWSSSATKIATTEY